MKSQYRDLIGGLRVFTTIDLTFKASNILEKLLWIVIGTVGTLWAIWAISSQFLMWSENPYIISKEKLDLSGLNNLSSPAMTICSKTSTKYAVAEQIGNYLNPHQSDMPQKVTSLRKAFLKCAHWWIVTEAKGKEKYEQDCIKKNYKGCEVSKKVSFYHKNFPLMVNLISM